MSSVDGNGRPLLRVDDLQTHFSTEAGTVAAVDRISFEVAAGESVGVVGESGCGKTITSLSIMRLVPPPGRIVGGRILFAGDDLLALPENRMRAYRGGRIAMIFQEPMTSLNPVFTVGSQIAEAIRIHEKKGKKDAMREAVEWMGRVAIPEPEQRARAYPHQLSGGMRQRIMIAMALSCRPQLLIADEPTTALDVTIQAQILDLLRRLREEYRLAVLLISHNLGVIAEFVRRVLVMYAGKIVEAAEVQDLFRDPRHPYTVGLMNSVPRLHGPEGGERPHRLPTIPGTVPNLRDLPPGCAFAPRCPDVMEECRRRVPPPITIDGARTVACFKYGDGNGQD
jgi:oligopeptide/dipeptide ABC transporter ATP-binding protein